MVVWENPYLCHLRVKFRQQAAADLEILAHALVDLPHGLFLTGDANQGVAELDQELVIGFALFALGDILHRADYSYSALIVVRFAQDIGSVEHNGIAAVAALKAVFGCPMIALGFN